MSQRIFAIPDIHGRLDLLDILLDKLYNEQNLDLTQDKLVFLGDMIDRGPDSYGVVEKIKSLCEKYPNNVVALAGNHEWINIQYFVRKLEDDIWNWENNGGPQTLDSYHRAGFISMTHEHIRWLAALPFKHEEPGFFFSHAPAPRENRRLLINRDQEFTPDELTWTFAPDEFGIARNHGNGIIGVCGHVHALRKGTWEPRFYDHYIYADSGCGCHPKAPLVAVNVQTREVIFAYAHLNNKEIL